MKRYSTVAIMLHWAIAIAIIGQIALGLYMTRLGDSQIERKFWLFQFHKSVGITVLFLSLARLVWRLLHRPPPPPAGQPRWERLAARLSHLAFYGFIIGMPLTGWVIVSTSPYDIPTYLYGVLHWPDLPMLGGLPNKAAISNEFSEIHDIAAYVLIGTVVLHVAAALKHHVWNGDEVLWRMIPLRALKPKEAQTQGSATQINANPNK